MDGFLQAAGVIVTMRNLRNILHSLRTNKWGHQMFLGLTLEMAAPICTCEEDNLTYEFDVDEDLHIRCEKCGVDLFIPSKHVTYEFKFRDKKYPADEKLDTGKDKPSVTDHEPPIA